MSKELQILLAIVVAGGIAYALTREQPQKMRIQPVPTTPEKKDDTSMASAAKTAIDNAGGVANLASSGGELLGNFLGGLI